MPSILVGRLTRRRLLLGATPLIALPLVGCEAGHFSRAGSGDLFSTPVPNAPSPPAQVNASGDVIGTGTVKVALILPKSAGGQSAAIAEQLRNAAALALKNYAGANLQLLVKDDGGTTEGGARAASEAIAAGAQLIIGPLLAVSARGAAGPARQANIPVVTFTTDTSVGGHGVYLISFLQSTDVERVISFAASQGRRSVAAVIPEDAFGAIAEAALRTSAANHDMRVLSIARYKDQTEMLAQAQEVGKLANQIDAVFVPDMATNAAQIVDAMVAAGLDTKRVKVLGTGRWNDPSAFQLASLNGAWFPAVDPDLTSAFRSEYRAAYGTDPFPLAVLGYEAVYLAAGLENKVGQNPFRAEVLSLRKGFIGRTGVFRFNPDGTNERGLAVLEIGGGTVHVVSPAPREFIS